MGENLKSIFKCRQIPLLIGSGIALISTGLLVKGKLTDFQERRQLAKKRARKQRERNEQLKMLESKFGLTEESLLILNLSFDDLQIKLATRQLSAKKVLEAYIAKAVAATKEFNCITEFVPQAMEWAEALDEMVEIKGPLHGIPVAIKENQDIEGMDSTFGLSMRLFRPAPKHDPLVQQLLDEGAIPFCKTNVPQTLFSYASTNPIFGTTLNHLNKKLGPGGSSSGGACLVGCGGAPFATATDIGGSVRIPAHFSGICGLKPTPGRICSKGVPEHSSTMPGLTSISGIMSQRAKTLSEIYRILIGTSPKQHYDPMITPISWNENIYSSKTSLRIGYLTSLPIFPALGDTPATVLKAKNTLEKLGHFLIPFEFPDNWFVRNVYFTLAYSDGRWWNYNRLKNDQVSDSGEKFMLGHTLLSRLWERIVIDCEERED